MLLLILLCGLFVLSFIVDLIDSDRIRKRVRRYLDSAKESSNTDGITQMLLPSVLGICVCAFCLAGGTYAWFTASQNVPTQSIIAANYDIEASVNMIDVPVVSEIGEESLTEPTKIPISAVAGDKYTFDLEKGYTYEVTLTAVGNAKTGYCTVKFNGVETVHTVQFPEGDGAETNSVTFKIVMKESANVSFVPQWGKSSSEAEKLPFADEKELEYSGNSGTNATVIPSESETTVPESETTVPESETTVPESETTVPEPETTVPEPTEYTEYTVVSGDTLSSIARKYGTSVEILQSYNGIEDANSIIVGNIIKIPITE